ncbi:heterodisulfide reductase-related iron-sulfur binding cluster [Dactylosporangium maewongense]|uniref:Heterodisulfide reductase-related iron-sulfur binding cluster n=1 Tax=Dactylosporangium maewongense TaxID=634393 RepID=A0ABP4NVF0_9ACTN
MVTAILSAPPAGEATRDTFQGFATWQVVLFYVLSTASIVVFVWGCLRLLRRYLVNRGRGTRLRPGRMLKVVLTHAWIGRRAGLVGLAHAGVFYGFIVLFAGTTILAINDHITAPLGWDFWVGPFYKGYSLFLDVFGAAMLVGLVGFAVRRAAARGVRLDYSRVDGRPVSAKRARYRLDDWVFLWSLIFLGGSGFLLEALRIAIDPPPFEVWSPIGYALGAGLHDAGLSPGVADGLRLGTWWAHGLVALAFVAAVPFTKAMHMFTGAAGVATRSETVSRELPAAPETGYATLKDFTTTHRLDLDACTKCGKCHEVCPARASAMPLSPRDLILDLREAQSLGNLNVLVPEVVAPQTLWSCMQCNACVDVCPVGIEHVPIINQMRRGLVEAGEVDASLAGVLTSIQKNGNSFGESKRKRARWTKTLDFELPDARKQPVDVLWYVGDYASLDARNQRNTQALARLLLEAGVDVGILYEEERTAGNDVRRAGEESLFQNLAAINIRTLSSCTFNRILTSDPHSFNTLRNEYPRLGAPWQKEQVTHHSVMLLELIEDGRLSIVNPLGRRGTYHDPCALGRYNGIFDEPRRLIERCGIELVEMPRNRSKSFCCGAGGGRIWMKETAEPGSRRPSEQRIDEAVALGDLDYFICACPKDVTMYEDAIKTSGHSDVIVLREISELVLAATRVPTDVAEAVTAAG